MQTSGRGIGPILRSPRQKAPVATRSPEKKLAVDLALSLLANCRMKEELTHIVLFVLVVAAVGLALHWLLIGRPAEKWENRRRIGFAPDPVVA